MSSSLYVFAIVRNVASAQSSACNVWFISRHFVNIYQKAKRTLVNSVIGIKKFESSCDITSELFGTEY